MNPARNSTRSFVFVALLALIQLPAAASDLTIRLVNDPAAGNSRPDDLYTSDLQIELQSDRRRIVFGERMFTDRQRRLRFDETHLSVATPFRSIAGWNTEASLGLLHVGQGVLGEGAQNIVHKAIGSALVELPYVADSRVYPTAAISLSRPLPRGALDLESRLDAYSAPGFRSWLRATLLAERPVGRSFTVGGAVGLRADWVETPWIGDEIRGASPTGHVSIAWRSVELRAAWNDYGTRSPHVSLGFKLDTP
jgi:hypothetical protein